ncbi:MAG: TfoX/Sxy family protein [Candidatus Sungbacteria bacterium]|nr:TfoX/Sxy family protein [Candidatus Sungbacteria bacterium]
MKRNIQFHDYVVYDLLGHVPDISSRPMFSGYGIYKHGKIFGIIVADELYFKANTATEHYFKEQGSHPFTYTKKDHKTHTMNYWLVPEEIMEDREKLAEWIAMAIVPGW